MSSTSGPYPPLDADTADTLLSALSVASAAVSLGDLRDDPAWMADARTVLDSIQAMIESGRIG
jgi:hypothetical protein